MATNYRNSRQRQRVYETVVHCGFHPTADWIYRSLRENDPTISLGTVYRNLDILCKLGLITPVGLGGGPEAFDCNPSLHYHLICTQCGSIEDIPLAYRSDIDNELTARGFCIDGHRMIFSGLCHRCVQVQTQDR